MSDNQNIHNVLVRVCANGHALVMYYARRDQPEPPCPACGQVQWQSKPNQEEER